MLGRPLESNEIAPEEEMALGRIFLKELSPKEIGLIYFFLNFDCKTVRGKEGGRVFLDKIDKLAQNLRLEPANSYSDIQRIIASVIEAAQHQNLPPNYAIVPAGRIRQACEEMVVSRTTVTELFGMGSKVAE